MSSNPSVASIPAPPAVLTSTNTQATAGSRESSEFEFVGNNGSGHGNNTGPPVTMQTDDSTQSRSKNHSSSINLSSTNTEVLDKGDTQTPEDEESSLPGLFGWMKGTGGGILSRVAEKTKNSMETVITTLDPQFNEKQKYQQPELLEWVKDTGGRFLSKVAKETKTSVEIVINTLDDQMKEYIRSGGDITIIVASDKDVKVQPVREAFQKVLGRATIYGVPTKESSTIAEQPVGFAAGRQAALERIQNIKGPKGRSPVEDELADENAVIVSIESFLLEVGDDCWVDIGCLILSDVHRGIHLTGYTQPTSVDSKYVAIVKEATSETYPKRWSGYAETIGEAIEKESGISRRDWHQTFCGVSRREIILLAATALAHSYQKILFSKVDEI